MESFKQVVAEQVCILPPGSDATDCTTHHHEGEVEDLDRCANQCVCTPEEKHVALACDPGTCVVGPHQPGPVKPKLGQGVCVYVTVKVSAFVDCPEDMSPEEAEDYALNAVEEEPSRYLDLDNVSIRNDLVAVSVEVPGKPQVLGRRHPRRAGGA